MANGTTVFEIADGIYRISTPVDAPELGGFTFNQFLVADEEPLLFHTGPRGVFPGTRDAIARVVPPDTLRWVAYSHHEADESGALNDLLAIAPGAQAACSTVSAMTTANDLALRPPRALADDEVLALGRHELVWIDAPHVPHGWDCGFLFERRTRTLLCGDLFTQAGAGDPPLTEGDVLGPSEAMRAAMDYYAHGPGTRAVLERLAALEPRTLACMHGSSWTGDGARLLRALADAVGAGP
jgi:flavorubredoxin